MNNAIDEMVTRYNYDNINISYNILRPFSLFHLFQDYQIFLVMLYGVIITAYRNNKIVVLSVTVMFIMQFALSLERTPLIIFCCMAGGQIMIKNNRTLFVAIIIGASLLYIRAYKSDEVQYKRIIGQDADGSIKAREVIYWALSFNEITSSTSNIVFGANKTSPLPIYDKYIPSHNS